MPWIMSPSRLQALLHLACEHLFWICQFTQKLIHVYSLNMNLHWKGKEKGILAGNSFACFGDAMHMECLVSFWMVIELIMMHWQELDLPLNASSWSEEDLKKPEKFYEMTVLLNAQREIADKILDSQWETKWRQEKVGKAASTPTV